MSVYNIMKSPIPDFLSSESENYDKSKVFTDGHFYLYNRTTAYLEARLNLFKQGTEETLTWILWCYVGAEDFLKFTDDPNEHRGILYAKLYPEICFYENTKDLEVILDFKKRDESFQPSVIIQSISQNEILINDFANGIDPSRFDSMISKINEE